MRFTPSTPGPAHRPSRPSLTQFLCYHDVRPTPTAQTTNALHPLLHSHSYSMQIYQHMTTICVGTHRLLQILNYATLATLHAVSLCLAAILFPTPTPMLLTRTGYPTGECQNFSTERHAPRETTATHAHRSLHHVTPPQVDERAITPDTSDATTPPLSEHRPQVTLLPTRP